VKDEVQIRCWNSKSGKKPVKKWLADLDKENFKKVDHLLGLLRKLKRSLSMPHSRNLGEGLYELRDRSTGPGYRIYYTWQENTLVILLGAGTKGSQDRDIEIARKRLADLDGE